MVADGTTFLGFFRSVAGPGRAVGFFWAPLGSALGKEPPISSTFSGDDPRKVLAGWRRLSEVESRLLRKGEPILIRSLGSEGCSST